MPGTGEETQVELSQASPKISLLIVEDHAAVRAGIRKLLRAAEDIEVVGEAADGAQAVELANQFSPDFMLLDMELPILRGDAVLHQVLPKHPDMRILVLSSHNDSVYIKAMLAGGARGYILKEEAPALLLTAIRTIHAQSAGAWLSPRISQTVALPTFEQELSWRELAILEALIDGQSEPEIYSGLNLSEDQLAKHLVLLTQKFEATSVNALLEIARRMLPPES